jgi:acyl transferase domain-containing protein/acyl carrier protein
MFNNDPQNSRTGSEIAVIGMAGRFPSARDIHRYWENLIKGVESISFFSHQELMEAGVDPQLLDNPRFVKSGGGILEDKDLFDAHFFSYTPAEAGLMDPQLRIFHECAWEALEDSGCDPFVYSGIIGIYAGASSSLKWVSGAVLSGKTEEMGLFAASNLMDKDFISPRLAYKLNLRGPAITLQTACSTSLVAVHMACQSLLDGECDMALAGGVSITGDNNRGYLHQEQMILSSDGHCRAFDARATGTIGGNGVGIVVLKLLENAIADRDNIYALIKGTAVNNDGTWKAGFTTPGREAHTRVIRLAQQVAEVESESITYIEAHGTGTILGDPIEVEALKQAFRTERKQFCGIGSVKTNIGHLDAAAGIASFIKTVLALKHKVIPPSLHYETHNPKIDFDNSPFYVVNKLTRWKSDKYPLRAGVSSLGIGGTNAHVVLEEAPEQYRSQFLDTTGRRKYQLVLLSAKTQTALQRMRENLSRYFRNNPDVSPADAAYTLAVGRKAFQYRTMILCQQAGELVENIVAPASVSWQSFSLQEEERPVVFMFSGQGSQYVDMALELYQTEPFFREEMDRCFTLLKSQTDVNIREILYPGINAQGSVNSGEPGNKSRRILEYPTTPPAQQPGANPGKINQTHITQLLIFILEYALAKLLMKWGIKPYALIGHSIGEYTAACLAGVFSLEEALSLVFTRGKLMKQMPSGAMLSVPLSQSQLTPLLDGTAALAAVNSSSLCVVSGTFEAIEKFEQKLKEKGYNFRRLHTSHAFHSPMMESIAAAFEEHVKQITLKEPKIPYISNVTGNWIQPREVTRPGYWSQHILQTVRFNEGLEKLLLEKENALMVEVGPGKALSTFVRQHKDKKESCQVINLLRHPKEQISDVYYLLNKIGQMWLYGVRIDWNQFYAGQEKNRISLPSYPFEGQQFSGPGDLSLMNLAMLSTKQSTGRRKNIEDMFYVPLWRQSVLTTIPAKETIPPAACLVLTDEIPFCRRLVEKLKHEKYDVIVVKKGDGFNKTSDHGYTVNPVQVAEYIDLLKDLARRNIQLHSIVNMWGITPSSKKDIDVELFDDAQYSGFYALIYIAQAVRKLCLTGELEIIVVTNNMQKVTGKEILQIEKSTVLGPIKVIPQEFPTIACRAVDIELPEDGSREEDKLVSQLAAEVSSHTTDTVLAYRNNRRWVQWFDAIRLDENKDRAFPGQLRQGGVYLITGGLGGVGLLLAEFLAASTGARLILTGRSPFPVRSKWKQWLSDHSKQDPISRKILKLREIEKIGGEVMIFSANVADPVQMEKVMTRAEERFGSINGVIHAAGHLKENANTCSVEHINSQVAESQFLSKVWGLLVLKRLLENRNPDFCLLTSSLASLLGGLGFACYSAANIFMDAFVQKHNPSSTIRWISVNWDSWQLTEKNHPMNLTPGESKAAFQHILNWQDAVQVVVSVGDLRTRMEQWIQLEHQKQGNSANKDDITALHTRPNLSNPYIAPRHSLEQQLAHIWQRFFGIKEVGIHDDFFELGGDSLKMITIISKIQKVLDIEIPISEFFAKPTIEGLTQYISRAQKSEYYSITPIEKKEYYELSSPQKRLYILQQLDRGSVAYNDNYVITLEGRFEPTRLKQAFQSLIRRHEILRTAFILSNEKPVQVVYELVDFRLEFETGSDNSASPLEHFKERIARFVRPFDLARAPLLRVRMITNSELKYILLLDMHHIITDGVSYDILVRELMAVYGGNTLAPLPIQYKDYALWSEKLHRSSTLRQQELFWLKQFDGEIPVLDIATDFPRPPMQSFKGETLKFELTEEITASLKKLATDTRTTLFMLLLGMYNVFLAKLTSLEDIVVGTPVAGRRHPDLENIMGIFINTLALRNFPAAEKRFTNFLEDLKQRTVEAFENQDFQFDELVEKLAIERNSSRNPLFDVMFVFQNLEAYKKNMPETKLRGLKLKPLDYSASASRFDLCLKGVEIGKKLSFSLQYCTELFEESTIHRFIDCFKNIISSVLEDPQKRLSDVRLIDEDQEMAMIEKIRVEKYGRFEVNRNSPMELKADFDL